MNAELEKWARRVLTENDGLDNSTLTDEYLQSLNAEVWVRALFEEIDKMEELHGLELGDLRAGRFQRVCESYDELKHRFGMGDKKC